MARRRFGADLTAVAWRTATVGGIDDVVLLARGASPITAWNAAQGGEQVTDLVTPAGVALTGGIITADALGLLDFLGPATTPETVSLWLDVGFGTRQLIAASDLGQQVVSTAGLVAGHTGDIAALDTRVDALEAAPGGGGGGGPDLTQVGVRPLDGFAGATDDEKLTAALTYAAAQTYPPGIGLTNRLHSFAASNRAPFEAMRIIGPEGFANPERNGQTKMPSRIALSGTGGLFQMPGATTLFGIYLAHLSFTGGSNTRILDQGSGTGSWGNLHMRDIYSSGLRNVLGSQAAKLLLLACYFDGIWQINNCYNGAFHLGGSDNNLWPGGLQLDSGTGFNSSGSANGQYHLWLDFMEKSNIGWQYTTAEGGWNGIRQTGPANPVTSGGGNLGGPNIFTGLRLEGRNAGAPCNGSLFRIEGGTAIIRDSWISYGMSSPATPGHSPADAGIIHQTGGVLVVDGCTYDRATGVAETVPWIYTSGGELMVTKATRGSKGGSWSGRPRVRADGGTVLVSDGSITII